MDSLRVLVADHVDHQGRPMAIEPAENYCGDRVTLLSHSISHALITRNLETIDADMRTIIGLLLRREQELLDEIDESPHVVGQRMSLLELCNRQEIARLCLQYQHFVELRDQVRAFNQELTNMDQNARMAAEREQLCNAINLARIVGAL